LKDGDHVPRPYAERVDAVHQFLEGNARFQDAELVVLALVDLDLGAFDNGGRTRLENGRGCETSGYSVMRIVRMPWAIATVLMRTLAPITMTPAGSSITTLATWSGSTSVRKSMTRSL